MVTFKPTFLPTYETVVTVGTVVTVVTLVTLVTVVTKKILPLFFFVSKSFTT